MCAGHMCGPYFHPLPGVQYPRVGVAELVSETAADLAVPGTPSDASTAAGVAVIYRPGETSTSARVESLSIVFNSKTGAEYDVTNDTIAAPSRRSRQ